MPRLTSRDDRTGWALLPLRLMIGFGFAAHGDDKLSKGPEGSVVTLQTLGMPAPWLMAWVTALGELLGGLALMAGAWVAIVSVPLAIICRSRCSRSTSLTGSRQSSSWR